MDLGRKGGGGFLFFTVLFFVRPERFCFLAGLVLKYAYDIDVTQF